MNDLKLIVESSGLSFRVPEGKLTESVKKELDGGGRLLVRRVPATILGEKNKNGRIYSKNEMEKAITKLRSKNAFEEKVLHCTADDHPEGTHVKPTQASHIVVDSYIEKVDGKDVLFNDWLVLETSKGKDLRALIEAGASVGTSIRGLGRMNEETSHIEDYSYLGTDAVGNPSSGTFAPFSTLEVTLECVSEDEAKLIESTFDEDKGKSKMKFDLQEAIDDFKDRYYKEGKAPSATSEIVNEIIAIESKAISAGVELSEDYNDFKVEVLGQIPQTEAKEEKEDELKKEATIDTLNKSDRQLAAADLITKQLHQKVESLQTDLSEAHKNLEDYKTASNKIIEEFADRAAVAMHKVEASKAEGQKALEVYRSAVMAEAEKVIGELQAEARRVIEQGEARLESAIRIGDIIYEHFDAVRKVARALEARCRKVSNLKAEDKKETSVKSRDMQVRESVKKNTNTRLGRQGWV